MNISGKIKTVLSVSVCCLLAAVVKAADVTWGGVESSEWSDPANWTGGAVPVAGDSVVIPSGKSVTLALSTPALSSLQV